MTEIVKLPKNQQQLMFVLLFIVEEIRMRCPLDEEENVQIARWDTLVMQPRKVFVIHLANVE